MKKRERRNESDIGLDLIHITPVYISLPLSPTHTYKNMRIHAHPRTHRKYIWACLMGIITLIYLWKIVTWTSSGETVLHYLQNKREEHTCESYSFVVECKPPVGNLNKYFMFNTSMVWHAIVLTKEPNRNRSDCLPTNVFSAFHFCFMEIQATSDKGQSESFNLGGSVWQHFHFLFRTERKFYIVPRSTSCAFSCVEGRVEYINAYLSNQSTQI